MKYVCLNCGAVDRPKALVKGNMAIEILLWIFFIVPGLIYSIWRMTGGGGKVCRVCGSKDILPENSPKGRAMIAEINAKRS